jgi:hypothetical protein
MDNHLHHEVDLFLPLALPFHVVDSYHAVLQDLQTDMNNVVLRLVLPFLLVEHPFHEPGIHHEE